jgi:hypothetical protein
MVKIHTSLIDVKTFLISIQEKISITVYLSYNLAWLERISSLKIILIIILILQILNSAQFVQ